MDWMERIDQIINTLDHVVVSGRDNFSRLLGCMQVLEEMKEEMAHDGHNQQG